MKSKLLQVYLPISILTISTFFYFFQLNKIPNGFYVDEATVAYNAKSILETGKDEYGYSYPVYFRLLGSYTPSLFIYLSSFLIKFLGNTPIVFRSISAISALVSVIIFYLLIRKMNIFKSSLSYYLITFFYGLSPWLIFNARVGYETTLAFMVFSIGMYFLFLAYEKTRYLSLSIFFLTFSTYISHNQRFLAPLALLTFFVVFRKKMLLTENYKNILIAFVFGLILNIPNLFLIGTNAFWIKSSQFDINNFWTLLAYLSPKTLFFENPDIDFQHTIPQISLFYNFLVIPYLWGFFVLFKKLKDYRYRFVILYLSATLVPAIFSSSFVSEQRALAAIFPLSIVIGIGIDMFCQKIRPTIILVFFSPLVIYSLVILYTSYFILLPKERFEAWNYGYKQIASYIKDRPNEKFLIDDSRNPRAYTLLLYHLDYPPSDYQTEVDPYYKNNYYKAPPPAPRYSFGNIEVCPIDWKIDASINQIIIGDPLSVSGSQIIEHKLDQVGDIKGPSGETVFIIYKTTLTSN